jgi:hypothetical protein
MAQLSAQSATLGNIGSMRLIHVEIASLARAPKSGRAFLLVITLLAAASIALRGEATPDVSWLITMCERILNGERAYVDIIDTTPPAPMLLYMPGVIVAKIVGITPEAATFAFAYVGVFGSLWLTSRIMPEFLKDCGPSAWLVLAPAAIVLLILPRDVFAQREYFAAAFALPMTAVFIRHADNQSWPTLADRVLAAILGGLSIAIKPPLFALPGVFVAIYYLARTQSLSFLLTSGLAAAAAISAVLTAAALAAFPDYLGEMSDFMRDVYVPQLDPALTFLGDRGCLGVLSCLALTVLLGLPGGVPAPAAIAAIAAAGFIAAYFIQGKFFHYHIYPAAVFSAIAATVVAFRKLRGFAFAPLSVRIAVFSVYGLVFGQIAILFAIGFADIRPVMRDLSWAKGLAHSRALAIARYNWTAFPLARSIGAVWVGRAHSQWIATYTKPLLGRDTLNPLERQLYLKYYSSSLEDILCEIKTKQPEIIFEDSLPESSWLSSELAALQPGFLDGYRILTEEGGIRVLYRK